MRPSVRFALLNPCFILALAAALLLLAFHSSGPPALTFDLARPVDFEGWIVRPPQPLPDGLYLELSPLEARQDGRPISIQGRIAVYLRSSIFRPEDLFETPLRYGDSIRFSVPLEEAGHYAIPGVPDFRENLWRQRIRLRARLKSPLQVERSTSSQAGPVTHRLFRRLERFERHSRQNLEGDQVKLIESAFLGRYKLLESTDYKLLKRLGIIHLFVVSGFHLSLVAWVLHAVFRRLGLAAILLTLIGIWTYVFLVGLGIPTLRAAVMITLVYLLWTQGLRASLLNSLGIAGLVVLAWLPDSAGSPGFQFSFLSLCAIGLLVVPAASTLAQLGHGVREAYGATVLVARTPEAVLRRRIRFWLEEKTQFLPAAPRRQFLRLLSLLLPYLLGLILCTLAIQVVTLPVGIYHFNLWVPTQVLTNLLVMPLFSVLIPLCLLLFVVFELPGGTTLTRITGLWTDLLNVLTIRLEEAAWAQYLPHPMWWETLGYFAFIMVVLRLPGPWKFVLLILPVAFVLVLRRAPEVDSERLAVTMLDVGQGESLLLQYPDGSAAFVDTGGLISALGGQEDFVGERLLARHLWHQRQGRIRYALLTHPHLDHIQGLLFLKSAFPVGRIYFYDARPEYEGPPGFLLQAGDEFRVGSVKHSVLHPPAAEAAGPLSVNDRSLVVELRYGEFAMLLTGDIERTAEQMLWRELEPVTVLKVAHHGGKSSSSLEVLGRTKPRAGLVSAGRKSHFGHPSPETVYRFEALEIPLYSTAEWGSLRIETDGHCWRLLHYSMAAKDYQVLQDWQTACPLSD